ncbi:MAG TPA: hypothetical protein VFY48_08560 [Solirubrobacterales bacterium]|nr:hypothetical protein [Solirubrobacterales bacterium]
MKHLIRTVTAGLVLAAIVAASALAEPKTFRVGNLVLRDNGAISPTKLPRHRQVPIGARIKARIWTSDGSHPPALERVTPEFDRTIQVNAEGLPVCRRSQLTARSTAAAKRACADAIVGSGEGEVTVAFPEQAPFAATGPIALFNGGVEGRTTLLLIHTYVNVPAPTAVVVPVKMTRIDRGHYGIHVDAQIPRIAGGAGSVTEFRISIDRRFTHRGQRQSYLTASCPTGRYYAAGVARFADGTKIEITHVLPCTPRG